MSAETGFDGPINIIDDGYYSKKELRHQIGLAKAQVTMATKDVHYAVVVLADVMRVESTPRAGRGARGRIVRATRTMERACARLEAAVALSAAIEAEWRWA